MGGPAQNRPISMSRGSLARFGGDEFVVVLDDFADVGYLEEVAAELLAAKAAGTETKPAAPTPPCTDPGPFGAAASAAGKPVEASGAHSPAGTAAKPPSGKSK